MPLNLRKAVASRSRAARAAAIICIGLICSTIAVAQVVTSPPANAAPADKDAYVNAQLAALFAGVPVRVALRLVLENRLLVEISPEKSESPFVMTMSHFDNEKAAQRDVQNELHFYESSLPKTKAGYDELYSNGDVRWIGRLGTSVVKMDAGPAAGFDAGFAALAQRLSGNPQRLPNLIRYAYSMHFGPTGPLHAMLVKLGGKVPGWSQQDLLDPGRYGPNSVETRFIDQDGTRTIVAKAYDSEAAARAGLAQDEMMIQVAPDNTETIQGVKVQVYTRYSVAIAFQHGLNAFRVNTRVGDHIDAQALLKLVSAMVELTAEPAPDR